MFGKVMDLVIAVGMMFLLPAALLCYGLDAIEAQKVSDSLENDIGVIQRQGYIRKEQLQRLGELFGDMKQGSVEIWYYSTAKEQVGIQLTLDGLIQEEMVEYQGEWVYPLQTGAMLEIRSGKKRWVYRIRDGLLERHIGEGCIKGQAGEWKNEIKSLYAIIRNSAVFRNYIAGKPSEAAGKGKSGKALL